ncbi:MAG TPA: tRNA (N6-isopentenyl adenosine(37)-C2)-methylthiotransferase MiaB, partial [Acetivibrio saccincola]|nr:tRNA (N6-isopentenyl adenosine(37)-C2)-methylthiotransferase MiaB [Acetivibrio saccincola]
MLERRDSHVLEEELERQKEFIQLVADRNDGKIPKYYLNTFGCQMNEHDSEKLAGMLSNMGYVETDDVDESDLIIYNTCCVREKAEQKVWITFFTSGNFG